MICLGFFDPVLSEGRSEAIARVKENGVARSSESDLAITREAAKQVGSVGDSAREALGRP